MSVRHSPKIALLTCEAHVSSSAVRAFLHANARDIAFVGLSDPSRKAQGGLLGQILRLLRSSGPRIFPYMIVNFELPVLAGLLGRPSLGKICEERGVPLFRVADVNGGDFRRRFVESGADMIVTFHFDQILSAATLALAGGGGLNVHPSLLPRHRGPTPTIHVLLDKEPEFGVTIHRLVPRIDAGPILFQRTLTLPPGTTSIQAAKQSHQAAVEPLTALLGKWPAEGETFSTPTPSAYTSFPTGAMLRDLRRRGRKLVDWRDALSALSTRP